MYFSIGKGVTCFMFYKGNIKINSHLRIDGMLLGLDRHILRKMQFDTYFW